MKISFTTITIEGLELSMGDKLNDAIKRAIQDKQQRERQEVSADVQAADLWSKLKKEVERGCESINQDKEKVKLVGGALKYEPINEKGYLSDSEFSVKNIILPGRRITVRNCGKYLSVEVVARRPIKSDVDEEPIEDEEMHFGIDGNGYVFLSGKDRRKLYDAEDVAVYLLEKLWT
jgi:hypothetical protein